MEHDSSRGGGICRDDRCSGLRCLRFAQAQSLEHTTSIGFQRKPSATRKAGLLDRREGCRAGRSSRNAKEPRASPRKREKKPFSPAARVAAPAGKAETPRNQVQVPPPPSRSVDDIERSV